MARVEADRSVYHVIEGENRFSVSQNELLADKWKTQSNDGPHCRVAGTGKMNGQTCSNGSLSSDAGDVYKRRDAGEEQCSSRASSPRCTFNSACVRRVLKRVFPFVDTLRGYSVVKDLPSDVIAGLTMGTLNITQGIAYAMLARLPPMYGLYTSFYPSILYFFLGSCRRVSFGTTALTCLMLGAVVDDAVASWEKDHVAGDQRTANVSEDTYPLVNITDSSEAMADTENMAVAYAMALTFAMGTLQVVLGLAHLGHLVTFLSEPLLRGYTTAVALHVCCSQLKAVFGTPSSRHSGPFKLIYTLQDFFHNLKHGNWITIGVAFTGLLVIVIARLIVSKKCKPQPRIPFPTELILIITAALASYYLKFHDDFHVVTIGPIPKGLPPVNASWMYLVPQMLIKSLTLGVISFVLSIAVCNVVADKGDHQVDADQELVASGLINTICPIFSSLCSAGSLSRSIVQQTVGGRTQVTGLVAAILVLCVILFIGPVFEPLPVAILAVIIMVSLTKLIMQFKDLIHLWRISTADFMVWLMTFTCTLLLGIDLGLAIGLVCNLLPVLRRTQRPYACLMGKIEGTDLYADIKLNPEATEVTGVKIFRFEAPLYFANGEHFRQLLVSETGVNVRDLSQSAHTPGVTYSYEKQHGYKLPHGSENSRQKKASRGYRAPSEEDQCESSFTLLPEPSVPDSSRTFAIVVDASAIHYVDSVTVRLLKETILDYRYSGIDVFLAQCRIKVSAALEKSGFYDHVSRRQVRASIQEAVNEAVRNHGQSSQTVPTCLEEDDNDTVNDFTSLELPMDEVESQGKKFLSLR